MKDEVLEKIETLIEKFRNLEIDFKKRYNLLRCIPTAKTTDLIEIKAFFSFLYLRGAINFRHRHCIFSWIHTQHFHCYDVKKSFQVLGTIYSIRRQNTRPERWRGDKYTAIREFFAGMLGPSTFVSVDKTLYPYRGKIGIKQYNPSKPAKYGLLYRNLCDAEVPYIYFTLPYNGKPYSPDNEY